jgi:hypothetical protein
MTGYKMRERESGFSFLTMSMMIIFFMRLHPQARMGWEAAKIAY